MVVEWANLYNVSLKVYVNPGCQTTLVFALKSIFWHTWIAIAAQSLHLPPRPVTKAIYLHASQTFVEQRTEMTFDCRIANITGPLVQGWNAPSQNLMNKALLEITINGQSYLSPFSPVVWSSAMPQRHIITSPHTYQQLRRTFLGTSRINSGSKCSNYYGPRAFGGSAIFVLILFFIICKMDIKI